MAKLESKWFTSRAEAELFAREHKGFYEVFTDYDLETRVIDYRFLVFYEND